MRPPPPAARRQHAGPLRRDQPAADARGRAGALLRAQHGHRASAPAQQAEWTADRHRPPRPPAAADAGGPRRRLRRRAAGRASSGRSTRPRASCRRGGAGSTTSTRRAEHLQPRPDDRVLRATPSDRHDLDVRRARRRAGRRRSCPASRTPPTTARPARTASASCSRSTCPSSTRAPTRPDGAMELYLPYAPVAAAVSQDVRTLTITLVARPRRLLRRRSSGFIASASTRLQRQAEELRDSADRDRHQATHDALTGLPNWELLRDRLEQGAGRRHPLRRRDRPAADRPGPVQGDQRQPRPHLRRQAALPGRPAAASRCCATATPSRGWAATSSPSCCPSVDGVAEAQAVAERLRESLHRPFDVDGVALDVEASIGIVLSPWHGTDTEDLLRNADIAMYAAKELKAGAVVFEPDEHVTAPVAADRARRPAPRAGGRRRAVPALPAQVHPGRRADRGRRGAAALAAPDRRGSSRPASSSRSPRAPASSCG